jgi:hypothetical protein
MYVDHNATIYKPGEALLTTNEHVETCATCDPEANRVILVPPSHRGAGTIRNAMEDVCRPHAHPLHAKKRAGVVDIVLDSKM